MGGDDIFSANTCFSGSRASPFRSLILSLTLRAIFIATDGSQVNTATLESTFRRLSRKRDNFRNEEAFLEFVFNSTQRKFLRNFKEYTSFGQLLKNGSYNCLTATIALCTCT